MLAICRIEIITIQITRTLYLAHLTVSHSVYIVSVSYKHRGVLVSSCVSLRLLLLTVSRNAYSE